MKKSIKTSLIIIAVALLAGIAGLIWLGSRPDEPELVGTSASDTAGSPSFEVNVEKPRMDRFLAGILPRKLEAKLVGDELRFGHTSSGAKVGNVAQDRIELSADGWELLVETDGKGGIAPGTRLAFPIEIANVQWTLRCRPADPAVGFLQATTRPSMSQSETSSQSKTFDVLDGRFLVEITRCEDAKTGEILDTEAGGNPGDAWPSDPLTLRGSFRGLPLVRR